MLCSRLRSIFARGFVMIINGEETRCETSALLSEFLVSRGFEPTRVAVELNGAIVPRAAFDKTTVTDKDRLEILHFVGGG